MAGAGSGDCSGSFWHRLHEVVRWLHQASALNTDLHIYAGSFAVLTLALKKIDLGVAYAVWAGAGTALIAVVGILYFKEPLSALKVLSIFLIIAGVIGLNLSGAKH